jgi:hypothetical protein
VTATNGSAPGEFDLAGYRAAHAEATHKTFRVVLGTQTNEDGTEHEDVVEFPEQSQWSLDAQDLMAQGDIVGALTELLGPEQTVLFRSYHWNGGEVLALFEALSKFSGFGTGQLSSRPRVPELTRRLS